MAHLMALEGTAAVKGKVGATPPSLDVSAASTYTTKVPCIIICFARTRRIGRTLSSSTATLSQGPYPLPPTLLVVDRLTVDFVTGKLTQVRYYSLSLYGVVQRDQFDIPVLSRKEIVDKLNRQSWD